MSVLAVTRARLGQAELLSGLALSKEMRRRIRSITSQLTRAPCLAVVLVGDRADSQRYIEHKARAAAECGIEMRVVRLPSTVRQSELHRALAAVNGDVAVDGVILQLPLPPHLHARPALFHIHPGKDVDGLHPLNAGHLFLQDQSPLLHVLTQQQQQQQNAIPGDVGSPSADPLAVAMTVSERLAHGLVGEPMLLPAHSGGYNTVHRRTHESKFFVPCTALAIRSILFSYLTRTAAFAHLVPSMTEEDGIATPLASSAAAPSPPPPIDKKPEKGRVRRDLHAVIVNKSMVVGVPTAALLQRAGGFVVTTCSRSNSLEAVRCLARQADVLITAYGVANVFDASCVKAGAVVIDAAINVLPVSGQEGVGDASADKESGRNGAQQQRKVSVCGDVDVNSVSSVVAAVTKTPGGVGPLTVSHLMMNVLKAYRLRHANHLYYNNIYTEFLKMYGTYDKVRDYAPSVALALRPPAATTPGDAAAGPAADATQREAVRAVWESEENDDETPHDDEDADNESYEV